MNLYSSHMDDSVWNKLVHFGGLVAENLTGDLEHRDQEKCLGCFPQCGGGTASPISD